MTRGRTTHTTPATIRDVARELGMSVATVSRALSRPELLRPQTRQRVMSVVERLGYRPNLLARGLRQGQAHAILFVAPNLSPFFLEIFAGAETVTRDTPFALLFGSSNGDLEREQHFFDQVASGRADGIILLTGVAPMAYASGERPLPPLVTVLERLPGAAVPAVHTDHHAGALEAVQHLIGLGHRRIAHITGLRRVPSTVRRLEGYREALAAAELPSPPELIHTGDFSMGSGAEGMTHLMGLPQPPTAVLCGNDEMAYGAIRALHKLGLSVPEAVSVVGFDDQNMAEFYNPPLTTVNIPRQELGRCAARQLIDQLAGRAVARDVVLPARLVIRESTAPPPARSPGSREYRARRRPR
ncbi:MAG TPA: LacI family DNA-binding transcriptional regulator [Steroidobacteraceae bacterium]|nr:LacI family DNA-binding transcriptional regulator [Steroidobacteraceae bacterium]